MKTLFINACVGKHSRTLKLARHLLDKFSKIEEVNLEELAVQALGEEQLVLRDKLLKEKNYSHEWFDLARQLASAERVVIASPMWNLSFNASVKNYIDKVLVGDITFNYNDKGGIENLTSIKEVIYVTTAGGPIFEDLGYSYIQAVAKVFFNIQEVKYYYAEGLDIFGNDVELILKQAMEKIDEYKEEVWL